MIFEPGFQRIVAFDQLQFGLAAAEQLGEQMLEVSVHDFERGDQPLARLAVEILDALPQPLDGFDQIVALGDQRGVLGLDLGQFLFGAQIDGAKPLALAPQLFEIGLDLGDVRQRRAFGDLGHGRDALRLDFQHLADFVLDIGEPAPRALAALLGAAELLARGAERLERGARGAVRSRRGALAFGQPVAGLALRFFSDLHLFEQRDPLLFEQPRRIDQAVALGRRLRKPRVQRRDLLGGALLGVDPGLLFAGDRVQPLLGELGFARQRLRFGAQFGDTDPADA